MTGENFLFFLEVHQMCYLARNHRRGCIPHETSSFLHVFVISTLSAEATTAAPTTTAEWRKELSDCRRTVEWSSPRTRADTPILPATMRTLPNMNVSVHFRKSTHVECVVTTWVLFGSIWRTIMNNGCCSSFVSLRGSSLVEWLVRLLLKRCFSINIFNYDARFETHSYHMPKLFSCFCLLARGWLGWRDRFPFPSQFLG